MKARNTRDGFGIETIHVTGTSFLLQSHPCEEGEWIVIEYDSEAEAAEAFTYVASRAHYGTAGL